MLVGKRNLVVRLGKKQTILLLKLGLTSVFALLILGVVFKIIPAIAIVAIVTLPWILKSIKNVEKNYDNPKAFRFAVNSVVVTHIMITLSLSVSFLGGQVK
jgi:1,4-dihydroxy-2-naphthoate octaprenyltransferase